MTDHTIDTAAGPLQVPEDLCFLPWMRLCGGDYEPHVAAVLARHLRPGGTFLDIGAHVGYFSRLAAPLVGPSGLVVSVEPVPDLARLLRLNLAGYPQCRVVEVAAWDSDTALDAIALHRNPENSGDNMVAPPEGKRWDWVTATGRKLDGVLTDVWLQRFAAGATEPALLQLVKLDVQGSEVRAIRGMAGILGARLPPLVVEVSPEHLERAGTSWEEMRALLYDIGYTTAEELGDVQANRERGYWDVVFGADGYSPDQ